MWNVYNFKSIKECAILTSLFLNCILNVLVLNCYNEWLLFIIRNLEDNYVSIPYVSFYHIYQELELYSLLYEPY